MKDQYWRTTVLPAIVAAAGPETDKPVIDVKTERIVRTIWCSAKNVSGQMLTNCTLNFVVDEGMVGSILRRCALIQAEVCTEPVDGTQRPSTEVYRGELHFDQASLKTHLTPPRGDTIRFRWEEGVFRLGAIVMTPLPGEPEKEEPVTPTPKPKEAVKSAAKAQNPAARAARLRKLADNLEFLSNWDGALEYYRQIKKDYPGSPQAKTAAERIKAITGK